MYNRCLRSLTAVGHVGPRPWSCHQEIDPVGTGMLPLPPGCWLGETSPRNIENIDSELTSGKLLRSCVICGSWRVRTRPSSRYSFVPAYNRLYLPIAYSAQSSFSQVEQVDPKRAGYGAFSAQIGDGRV